MTMNHEYEISYKTIGNKTYKVFKCRLCRSTTFEGDDNPYYNVACSRRFDLNENLRKELSK